MAANRDPFVSDAYYAELINRLRGESAFRPFEPILPDDMPIPPDWSKPTGKTVPCPPWAQPAPLPTLGSLRDYRPIRYLGDAYPTSTPPRHDPRRSTGGFHSILTAWQINQKSTSIRAAIAAYAPGEGFMSYLWGYFLPQFYRHRRAINSTLGNILQQFNLLRPGKRASARVIRKYLEAAKECRTVRYGLGAQAKAFHKPPELAHVFLMYSYARWEAPQYPELVAANVLYQSALGAYLDGMRATISCSIFLERYEKEIACDVIDRSLQPLREFVLFAIFQPLVIQNHQEGSKDLNKAIGQAWNDLFKARLHITEMGDDRMTCAGNHHLRFICNNKVIQNILQFVTSQRDNPHIARLLADTVGVCQEAMRYPWHYYEYFNQNKSKLEAIASWRKRGPTTK